MERKNTVLVLLSLLILTSCEGRFVYSTPAPPPPPVVITVQNPPKTDYEFHLYADYEAEESDRNTHYTQRDAVIVPPVVLAIAELSEDSPIPNYSKSKLFIGPTAYCLYETIDGYNKHYQHLKRCYGIGYSGAPFPAGTRVHIDNLSAVNGEVIWCWYYYYGVLDPMEIGGNYFQTNPSGYPNPNQAY